MTEPHRCAAGRDCRDAETVDDAGKSVRRGAPIAEERGLCEGCVRRVQYAVEDLPADYVALHVSLGEASTAGGMKVNSTPTPAIPIDAHKFAVMTAISENLDRAAEIVSEALNCDPPQGKTAPRLGKAARMVATNLPKLLAAGEVDCYQWQRCDSRCPTNGCEQGEHLRLGEIDGTQLALTLLNLHRRAHACVGETEKLIRLPMRCPNCGAPFCFQRPDSDTVFCRECSWDVTEQLYAFAGKLSEQQQMEAEKVADQELLKRVELAEWLLAEREWQLSLALQCPNVSAADFAREIMGIRHSRDCADAI